jgi:hypothetical protein
VAMGGFQGACQPLGVPSSGDFLGGGHYCRDAEQKILRSLIRLAMLTVCAAAERTRVTLVAWIFWIF